MPGMKPIARTYLSLSAFYAADQRRRDSRERDIGLWWRSSRGPTYRAAWIQDTGELYLFQHALTGPGSGSVHLVSGRFGAAELDQVLDGWRERVGRAGSLEWLLETVTAQGGARTAAGSRPPAPARLRPTGSGRERNRRSGSTTRPPAQTAHSAA
jgi:hypothetical protein